MTNTDEHKADSMYCGNGGIIEVENKKLTSSFSNPISLLSMKNSFKP